MFAQLSTFQQGFTGSHNLTGSTDRRTRRFGATTDNDTGAGDSVSGQPHIYTQRY